MPLTTFLADSFREEFTEARLRADDVRLLLRTFFEESAAVLLFEVCFLTTDDFAADFFEDVVEVVFDVVLDVVDLMGFVGFVADADFL